MGRGHGGAICIRARPLCMGLLQIAERGLQTCHRLLDH